jgi:hypothetical protein
LSYPATAQNAQSLTHEGFAQDLNLSQRESGVYG